MADWTLMQYMSGLIGLIPTYCPEDVYASHTLGALEALDSGVARVLDWCQRVPTPDRADAETLTSRIKMRGPDARHPNETGKDGK